MALFFCTAFFTWRFMWRFFSHIWYYNSLCEPQSGAGNIGCQKGLSILREIQWNSQNRFQMLSLLCEKKKWVCWSLWNCWCRVQALWGIQTIRWAASANRALLAIKNNWVITLDHLGNISNEKNADAVWAVGLHREMVKKTFLLHLHFMLDFWAHLKFSLLCFRLRRA